jgi:hypothetical protein
MTHNAAYDDTQHICLSRQPATNRDWLLVCMLEMAWQRQLLSTVTRVLRRIPPPLCRKALASMAASGCCMQQPGDTAYAGAFVLLAESTCQATCHGTLSSTSQYRQPCPQTHQAAPDCTAA